MNEKAVRPHKRTGAADARPSVRERLMSHDGEKQRRPKRRATSSARRRNAYGCTTSQLSTNLKGRFRADACQQRAEHAGGSAATHERVAQAKEHGTMTLYSERRLIVFEKSTATTLTYPRGGAGA
jgi:hypothetical protein